MKLSRISTELLFDDKDPVGAGVAVGVGVFVGAGVFVGVGVFVGTGVFVGVTVGRLLTYTVALSSVSLLESSISHTVPVPAMHP